MTVPRFWREQPQRYRLMGSECPDCQRVYFPPRGVCPVCRRESVGRLRARHLSGRGTVLTWTVVHQPAAEFERQVPYVIALVELEEKCRVLAQIVEVAPDAVRTGLAVESCFRRIREDGKSGIIYYGYKFRVARAVAQESAEPAARARPRGTDKRRR